MQHVLRCWERQSDAQNTRKPFGGRLWALQQGIYSAPTNPLAGGEGLAAPPQKPHPNLGPSGLASPTPTPKLVLTPLHTEAKDH